MFTRKLTSDEVERIHKMIAFVKEKHMDCEGHDHSHVMEVVKHAIDIAESITERVDPFVLIVGALLHDIGRINATSGALHELEGASVAEEFLEASGVDDKTVKKISRIVARHTPTPMIAPETVEEKIVFDADLLDWLGYVGVIRGVLGKKGSIETILKRAINKRATEYELLCFDKSKKLGKPAYDETKAAIESLQIRLARRARDIHEIQLPV